MCQESLTVNNFILTINSKTNIFNLSPVNRLT